MKGVPEFLPALVDAIINAAASHTLAAAIEEPAIGSSSSRSACLLALIAGHALRHVHHGAVHGHLVDLCGVLGVVHQNRAFLFEFPGARWTLPGAPPCVAFRGEVSGGQREGRGTYK
ncbi:hypothetical protein E2C01_002887 [Portunus trituberculatus]|uniref:Uncharacterized protein n=1 Tax=Portunus trituberculatus TaxID=210409 RepID=A0A5B7CLY3_PORTR|nr:hypothetical protein [Portunus trituberculatus]